MLTALFFVIFVMLGGLTVMYFVSTAVERAREKKEKKNKQE